METLRKHLPEDSRIPGKALPVSDADRERLLQALRETGGNQTRAARKLGVSRVTVWKKIRKYGIDLERLLT